MKRHILPVIKDTVTLKTLMTDPQVVYNHWELHPCTASARIKTASRQFSAASDNTTQSEGSKSKREHREVKQRTEQRQGIGSGCYTNSNQLVYERRIQDGYIYNAGIIYFVSLCVSKNISDLTICNTKEHSSPPGFCHEYVKCTHITYMFDPEYWTHLKTVDIEHVCGKRYYLVTRGNVVQVNLWSQVSLSVRVSAPFVMNERTNHRLHNKYF